MKKFIILIAAVILIFTACNKEEAPQPVERKFDQEKVAENKPAATEAEALKKVKAPVEAEAEEAKTEKKAVEAEPEKIPVFKTKITGFNTESNGTYSVVFNGKIRVNGIKLENGRAIMPYNEYNGKKYYFVWAESTAFLKMVADAISNKKIATGSVVEFSDADVRLRDSGTLKGYGEITVNGEFQIKSIPVFIGGRYGDGTGDPAVKVDGEWVPMVEVLDKELKKAMEADILEKYYSLSS